MPVKPMLLLQKEEQGLAVGSSLCRASADGEGVRDDEEDELARALLLEKLVIFCVSVTKDLQQQLKEEFIFMQFGGTVHMAHSVGPGTLSAVRKQSEEHWHSACILLCPQPETLPTFRVDVTPQLT